MASDMKKVKINCEKKTKTGFSCNSFERFGDDLCELLLSYLSISDKIRFECVSKQWQQLVFNKQQILIINHWVNHFDVILIKNDFWIKNKLSIIECLTKKFKFLIKLKINFPLKSNNEVLGIIAKNCKYLRKITIYGPEVKGYCEIFGQKCGQKLESIYFNCVDKTEMVSLLRSTPNLKKAGVCGNLNAVLEQYLPHLENINVWEFSGEKIEKFTNLYNKQIKKISFIYLAQNKAIIPYLSRFENLESLYIQTFRYEWNEDFISMAEKLKNLKRFKISTPEVNHSFALFKIFNNLEAFELISNELKDEDMKVIETLNLTKLEILFSKQISDELVKKLVKMKRLSEFYLNSKTITDSVICYLIKNSPKLKTFLTNDKHINEKTIEVFIEKALSNPKINYKFISKELNRKRLTNDRIPKNLSIQKLI
jgi:hypothetical protein